MANTYNTGRSPQLAVLKFCDLSAATALTSRAPITGTTGLTACVPTTTADTQIRKLAVKAISSSGTAPTDAQLIGVWVSDGTTATLKKEIVVAAVTPSTTVASFESEALYDDLMLPIGSSLWLSTTVTTTASTTALGVTAHGDSM